MLLLLDAAVTNVQRLGFGSREYDSDVGKFKERMFSEWLWSRDKEIFALTITRRWRTL